MADETPTVSGGALGAIGLNRRDNDRSNPNSGAARRAARPAQILFWFSVAVGLGAANIALTAGRRLAKRAQCC